MTKRCYYETLECQKGATVESSKTAYRKLAMKFHPDRNPGDATAEIKFKEISEAYDVLKDDQKRAAYDRFGHAAFESGMGAAPAPIPSISRAASPMCSTICSASSWAGAARAAAIAARICATIWRSRWRRPSPAAPRKSKSPPW